MDGSSPDKVKQEVESIGDINALEDVAKGLNPSSTGTFSSIDVDPGSESDEVRLLVLVRFWLL